MPTNPGGRCKRAQQNCQPPSEIHKQIKVFIANHLCLIDKHGGSTKETV